MKRVYYTHTSGTFIYYFDDNRKKIWHRLMPRPNIAVIRAHEQQQQQRWLGIAVCVLSLRPKTNRRVISTGVGHTFNIDARLYMYSLSIDNGKIVILAPLLLIIFILAEVG